MKKLYVIYLALLAAAIMTGCGGHTGGQGADGQDGQVGVPGFTPTATVGQAPAAQCPTGGSEITVVNQTSSQTTYVCNGVAGSNGDAGPKGDAGATGPQGVAGNDGRDGSNGADGRDGANGSNGADGSNGQNATPVTLIKLCSETPTYPSVFVEYAICLDSQLYAVYSANGGFMALLPPGAYSSNGIGSSCNFVVGPNCQVSR